MGSRSGDDDGNDNDDDDGDDDDEDDGNDDDYGDGDGDGGGDGAGGGDNDDDNDDDLAYVNVLMKYMFPCKNVRTFFLILQQQKTRAGPNVRFFFGVDILCPTMRKCSINNEMEV